jgi:hypothetical protein
VTVTVSMSSTPSPSMTVASAGANDAVIFGDVFQVIFSSSAFVYSTPYQSLILAPAFSVSVYSVSIL